MADEIVHLFSFDPRFCGSKKEHRRVSPSERDITCPECLKNMKKANHDRVPRR